MAKRIPAIPDPWQDYFICLAFHMILPLFPLGIEYFCTSTISEKTLDLTAAIYGVSIGGSSRSKLLFGSGVFVSIIFAIAFGIAIGQSSQSSQAVTNPMLPLPFTGILAGICIFLIFVVHAAERYNRHIVDRTPFWEF
jgi:hypothetical protein